MCHFLNLLFFKVRIHLKAEMFFCNPERFNIVYESVSPKTRDKTTLLSRDAYGAFMEWKLCSSFEIIGVAMEVILS